MFNLFVASFVALFVGGPAVYVVYTARQEHQFKAAALDYSAYSEPIPFGVADGFSQRAQSHLDGFEAEKRYRYPEELERDELYRLDDEPMPLPTPLPTQPGTAAGTPNRTGVTHGTTSESTFQPSFGNVSSDVSEDFGQDFGNVSESLSAGEALQLEREIKAFAPFPIDADDENSLFAVESALRLQKPKSWMCKELFGGIKPGGNKDYQTFNELLEKASV